MHPGSPSSSGEHPARRRLPHDARRRNLVLLACILLFALLTAIRVLNIWSNTPEYDELWTVQHYRDLPIPTVLSDVSTPNNHVLNTLGIKFFLSVLPHHNFTVRLTALLGFCGLFVILLRAVLLLLKNDAARCAVLTVVLLNGMLLHYAETARGYSLQSFFVFGLLFSLLCFQFRPPENRTFNAVMWLLCAAGACLSVSSGVLFVVFLTGLWGLLYLPFRDGVRNVWQNNRPLILAGAVWCVFVLAWYGGNYSRFSAGRAMFGDSFSSLSQYLAYCFGTARDTGLVWTLPCLAVCGGLLRNRPQWRICALTGGAVVLMYFSALITKGGPARVYLPLFAPAVFGIGMAADALMTDFPKFRRFSLWFLLALAAVCIFFSDGDRRRAASPDLAAVFREVVKTDSHVFVSYKSTDLYVLRMLFPETILPDNYERQGNPEMLLLLHDDRISAVHVGNPPVEEFVPPGATPVESGFVVPGEDVQFWLYRLRPLRPGENLDGKAVLCFTDETIPDDMKHRLVDNLGVVNSMIFSPETPRICYGTPGTGLDADALLRMQAATSGGLFFRVVSD
ncbi:MAG: hypothetical protein J6Y92_10850 [Lentisphaeria bacterium]|nr:hypothetical protein [Lentisphaeria bacterium]